MPQYYEEASDVMIADAAHGLDAPTDADDCRVHDIQPLLPAWTLMRQQPVSRAVRTRVQKTRLAIHRMLSGADPRLLVVVGPCSIHDEEAALEYARWLSAVSAPLAERLLVVMRVYITKPRTNLGWKGLTNDPWLDGSFRVNDGLTLARTLMHDINALGLPVATEFVDPITPQYLADLVSWGAIGARTAESQVHRELASGLSCPVGFKNGTNGDVGIAINGVLAARSQHQFMGVTKFGLAAIIATTGNPDGHVILRGGPTPNYDAASIASAAARLRALGLGDRVMVDCSHGNASGDYRRQLDVAASVCAGLRAASTPILGVMVESHLREGKQSPDARDLTYGQSITDACLGLDNTARLLHMLADATAR